MAESRFVLAVQDVVAKIAANPMSGSRSLVDPVRSLRVKKFPYTVHFRPLGAGWAEVVAVAHDKRRPGYWLRRTRVP